MTVGRRRTRSKNAESSWLTTRTLAVVGGVLLVIIIAPIAWGMVSGDGDIPDVLEGHVQELPDEGNAHVADGTTVEYDTEPPTSGPHYNSWAPPDLYRETLPDELLVHNLEHGHIIVHYHPTRISNDSAQKITELTSEFTGQWDAVLAVPRPGMDYELVLTAWTYMLELEEFDEELIDAFIDAFRGRGPENPVR